MERKLVKHSEIRSCAGEYYLQSLLFGFHKFFISLLTDEDINNLSPLKVAQISMIAGGISSSCTLTLTYQLYLCQTLIAAYRGRPEDAKYSTVFGCLRRVYLKEGIRGTFTGFYMSQAFVITSRTLYFGLYDTIKSFHLPMYNLPPTFVKFLYAQTTTLIASFVAYPMETISRRLILEAGLKRKVYHGDSIKCIKVLYREEGIKGFFAGGLTNMIRSVGGAIVLVLHEDFSRRAVKWIELHKH
ncbi:hypothetical protein O3M35_013264 [Rhynocoris fuscipes]|uniref:ADP/ATP translocase n=1 Tax=Rhynocoris fuscipes TaxID=488301 RepID=A0AAW1CJ15_9HEMI